MNVPERQIEVARLSIHPVKSMRGIDLGEAELTPMGIRDIRSGLRDRQFMVIDGEGKMVTQRTFPQMASLQPSVLSGDRRLGLRSANFDMSGIGFPIAGDSGDDPERVRVMLHGKETEGIEVHGEINGWLNQFAGRVGSRIYGHGSKKGPLRLVRFPDDGERVVDPDFLGEENDYRTAFADGWPFLVTAEESVDDLTQRVRWAVEPRRFRPNIHLRGLDEAYREDAIKRLRFASNDAVLAMLKPCARCPVPNVDPGTGRVERGKKPTIALKAYRKLVSGEVLFGQNAVLEGVDSVIVKVGDVLEIDEMKGPEEMPTFV